MAVADKEADKVAIKVADKKEPFQKETLNPLPLVSIIVPIYKVELYLRRCLDSIVNQTYTNLEIILVDDGSPDACPQICDEYAAKDKRIVVIHKENGGLSDARNAGLCIISGDFIFFVDSDDIITPNCIEIFITEIQKKDYEIIIAKHSSSHIIEKKQNFSNELKTNKQIIEAFCKTDFSPCAWNKLYKAKFIKDNRLHFFKGILFEDQLWSLQWVTRASHICLLSNITYTYNTRNASIMDSCTTDLSKSLNSWKIILSEYNKQLSNSNYSNQIKHKILIQKIEESLFPASRNFFQFKKYYKQLLSVISIPSIYRNYKTQNHLKRVLYQFFSFLPSTIFQILLYFHIKTKK